MTQPPDPMTTPLHEWIDREDLLTRPRWHFGPNPPPPMELTPDQRWQHSVLDDMEDPADFEVEGLHGSDLLTAEDQEKLTFWFRLLIDRCWGAWGEANDPRWPGITVDETGTVRWADEGARLRYLMMLVTVGEFVVTLDGAMVRDQQLLMSIRRQLTRAMTEAHQG